MMIVDADTGKPREPILLGNEIPAVAALDLAPDGKTLAVVGRGKLRLYDMAGGKMKAEYEVHKGYAVTARRILRRWKAVGHRRHGQCRRRD